MTWHHSGVLGGGEWRVYVSAVSIFPLYNKMCCAICFSGYRIFFYFLLIGWYPSFVIQYNATNLYKSDVWIATCVFPLPAGCDKTSMLWNTTKFVTWVAPIMGHCSLYLVTYVCYVSSFRYVGPKKTPEKRGIVQIVLIRRTGIGWNYADQVGPRHCGVKPFCFSFFFHIRTA